MAPGTITHFGTSQSKYGNISIATVFWPSSLKSIFVPDLDIITMIGDAQSTFKRTHFAFLLFSSGITCSQRFIENSINARQICLSSCILGQRLLPKVQCITQLPSFPSDGHGAMLKPRRSEEYDSPLSG
jgi:hypothetical protein